MMLDIGHQDVDVSALQHLKQYLKSSDTPQSHKYTLVYTTSCVYIYSMCLSHKPAQPITEHYTAQPQPHVSVLISLHR